MASALGMIHGTHKDLIVFIAGLWNARLFFQNKMDFRVLEEILDLGQKPAVREAKDMNSK